MYTYICVHTYLTLRVVLILCTCAHHTALRCVYDTYTYIYHIYIYTCMYLCIGLTRCEHSVQNAFCTGWRGAMDASSL